MVELWQLPAPEAGGDAGDAGGGSEAVTTHSSGDASAQEAHADTAGAAGEPRSKARAGVAGADAASRLRVKLYYNHEPLVPLPRGARRSGGEGHRVSTSRNLRAGSASAAEGDSTSEAGLLRRPAGSLAAAEPHAPRVATADSTIQSSTTGSGAHASSEASNKMAESFQPGVSARSLPARYVEASSVAVDDLRQLLAPLAISDEVHQRVCFHDGGRPAPQ